MSIELHDDGLATWYGKQISDLSRSELLMLVQQLANENRHLREERNALHGLVDPIKRLMQGARK